MLDKFQFLSTHLTITSLIFLSSILILASTNSIFISKRKSLKLIFIVFGFFCFRISGISLKLSGSNSGSEIYLYSSFKTAIFSVEFVLLVKLAIASTTEKSISLLFRHSSISLINSSSLIPNFICNFITSSITGLFS